MTAAKTIPAVSAGSDVARAALVRLAEEARAWLPLLATRANARPIGDRVLVMMLDEPTQDVDPSGNVAGGRRDDRSGLYVVEDHRKVWRAVVLRVSSKVDTLAEGDCIVLGEHVGQRIPLDESVDLRLVKEHDVLARFVFEEERTDDAPTFEQVPLKSVQYPQT